MATEGDVEANRKAALDGLRFRKTARRDVSGVGTFQPELNSIPTHSLPAQSRDASSTFRYHPPATPSTTATVLVPNSSPLSADNHYQQPPHLNQQRSAYESSSMLDFGHYTSWNPANQSTALDPLSSSSGFLNDGFPVPTHASFTRHHGGDTRRLSEVDGFVDDGPPRKRINRGNPLQVPGERTSGQPNVLVPDSPDIQRPGYRRKVNAESTSSDESLPDIRHSLDTPPPPGRSRIVRGHRPGFSAATAQKEVVQSKDAFTKFKILNPERDPVLVQAAWIQAGGDIKKATDLLHDPSWKPPPPIRYQSPSAAVSDILNETGRVAEVDEANKASRAAMKEKAKKSSIYANRGVLDTTPATPIASTSFVASPISPSTPLVKPPRRRRLNNVLMSDSEQSDTDSRPYSKRPPAERSAFNYFNTAHSDALQELTGCTPEQAGVIVSLRPFRSVDDLIVKLGQGKKKAGPAGISPRIFEDCQTVLSGYGTVDNVLEKCERIGASLRAAIASWGSEDDDRKGKGKEDYTLGEVEDGSLSLRSLNVVKGNVSKQYIATQPAILPDGVTLKEYQLLGVNWLYLLYMREYSCILADEMGLGKTIQVISFFAHMKEKGNVGPHLIVVPSSTLENWCREFARFAPSISVQTYYAGKEERPALRQTLFETQRRRNKNSTGWEVLITTYNLAQGDERDRKFFRKIEWDSIVFDEGHVLKNFQSQRYQALLKFEARWRLLLTGTPLQNNLQELVSLLNFILPNLLGDAMDSLRTIFKTKGDAKVTLLSQERVSRAKKMMTPFVLRRRKDQVLNDLPSKVERVEWCDMTDIQRSIYLDALRRSRKTILEVGSKTPSTSGTSTPNVAGKPPKKPKGTRPKDKYAENSSNVLMDLRKAASHPMLFRKLFTDQILTSMTKVLLKEPDFKKRGAVFDYVKEDMEVMTDAELQLFCQGYKVYKCSYRRSSTLTSDQSTRKFLQDETCYLNSGKVTFTQILDILQAILKLKNIKYLILTGSTAVDVRQSLVDEFTEDESIPVFLLSTKAGGMGIQPHGCKRGHHVFDQDFNPHNDRQAQDRAYRIGQKRDVEVVKLITQGTIEEDMLRLGETKLALDEAVAGEGEDGDGDKGESTQEKEMKMSLMNVLRKQLEQQDSVASLPTT
ncbi:SNF2 family N-terminal domain-containing protein [Pisolithus microcarpus]|nr:SNF2 family N-terminal domain-containing protein [Pisolithus microcarpus]